MKRNRLISTFLLIAWMLFIFIMSSFNSTESSSQSGFIVNIISSILNINNTEILSLIIRKLAHFTEYFILGILAYNTTKLHNKKKHLAIIVCIIYAISDEIHQIFVPGRNCQITDICIDSIGSIIGIYLFNLINKNIKKKQKI